MSIPGRVQKCLDAFSIDSDDTRSEILDELGRFKVWRGNVAAHHPVHSRRSLEYRLRDASSLKETVLSLLEDLENALHFLRQAVVAQSSLSYGNEILSVEQEQSSEVQQSDADYLHRNEDWFEISDEDDSEDVDEVHEALNEVHEVITCLFRFSMALRSPGRSDARRKGPVMEYFVPHAIEHVRAKYPNAPDFLIERLGRCIASHRQYFKYREMHHELLQEEIKADGSEYGERRSTLATSLPGSMPMNEQADGHYAESDYTQTSYAGTTADSEDLPMPQWPLTAQEGEPFECPICYRFVEAGSSQSWHHHIFEDIPPYICTHDVCVIAATPFSRRRDWEHHVKHAHQTVWSCPLQCNELLSSMDELQSHLQSVHSQRFEPQALHQMMSANVRMAAPDKPWACPLCSKVSGSCKSWTKHVGHHLEQLALFALPPALFDGGDLADAQQKDEEEPIVDIQEAVKAAVKAAEDAAEDAAKAAKEESDKKLAEAEAARAELEKKHKELEEAMKKNEPIPDMLKAPIKFKDAVGRKFSFPWHLCKTWKGMESLIKQAFLHVDVIGQHVQEGRYDLMGPDGEIILPQVWDTMVKPDWEVSMHMWPLAESLKERRPGKAAAPVDGNPCDPLEFVSTRNLVPAAAASKKARKRFPIVEVPTALSAGSPPAGFPASDAFMSPSAGVDTISTEAAPKQKKKQKDLSGIAAWMAGGKLPTRKRGDEDEARPGTATWTTGGNLHPEKQSDEDEARPR